MKIERRRGAAALAVACVMVMWAVMCVPAVAGSVGETGAVDVPVNTVAAVRVHGRVGHGHRHYVHGRRHGHGKHRRHGRTATTRQVAGPVSDEEAIEQALVSRDGSSRDGVGSDVGTINETYGGLHQWVGDDLISNLFSYIGQLVGKWISEIIDGWIADGVQFLTVLLVGIARLPLVVLGWLPCKLVLLLVSAGSVIPFMARGLFYRTSYRDLGVVVKWTAIPCLIVGQCILLQSFVSAGQLTMLDTALASAVRGGILAGVGGLASMFAPLLGAACGGAFGGLVGELFAFVGLVVFIVMGGAMILLLLANMAARAVHLLLLCIELIDFRAGRSNPEVLRGNCLSFLLCAWRELQWIVLLRLLVGVSFSDANPWLKTVLALLLLWQTYKVMRGQVRLDLARFALRW